MKKGWLDYIAPQLYWYIGQPPADYAKLVPWWSDVANGTGTLLWIGQAAYKAGDPAQTAPEWQNPAELSKHLTLNRDNSPVSGDIWYNANDLRADRIGSISTAVNDHYTRPALAPVLTRLAGGEAPHRPVLAYALRKHGGVEVRAVATDRHEPFQFAIFRFPGKAAAGAFADARNLVAVLPGDRQVHWVDPEGKRGDHYYVVAVDRANRTSKPSNGFRVL